MEVAISQSLQPWLHATSAGGTTGDTLHFYARHVGAPSWDLIDNSVQTGPDSYVQLPSPLNIGEAFQYQVTDCDNADGACASSPVTTGYASPALGAGERPGATRIPFTIGDKIAAQVDVGSGNLLLTTTQFSLPRRSGGTLDVGLAYNSVTRTAQGAFDDTSIAPGWRLSTATDVRLASVHGGDAVVYYGPNGLTGTFLTDGNGGYTPPTGFTMDLATVSGGGWTLYDHGAGETRHFTAAGIMTSLTDRNNNPETFTYNASGVLTSISSDRGPTGARTLTVNHGGSFAGQVTGFTQTPDSSYTGLAARSVTYHYDAYTGFLTSITDTLGRTTSFGYGANNNLNTITAPGGAQTSFTYDGNGRVQTVTQPTATSGVSAVTRFSYNDTDGSRATLVADPDSNQSQTVVAAAHTTYDLTGDGQLLVGQAIDQLGKSRSTSYTPFNDVDSATDATGQTTTTSHNANNQESLTGITSPTGAGNSFAYGNSAPAKYSPSQSTDGQGNSSTYSYDNAGNGMSSTDAGNNKASVTRNPNGDGTITASTAPSGAVTHYGYDTLGQQTSMTPPTGGSLAARHFTYDGFGRLATLTDGRGITTTYAYDAGDRITQVSYSDSTHAVTYDYNTGGGVQTRTDASGTTSYSYDPLGRLTSRSNTANSGGVSYSYDKAGNLATATNTAGTSSYTYDAREVVTAMTDPAGRVIHFAADDNGRRTDTWFNTNTANTSFGAHTHTTYDESGRITEVWTSEASNDNTKVSDLQYGYGYDNDGGACPASAMAGGTDTSLRWVAHDVLSNVYTNYCYDTSNRLLVADPGAGSTYTYSYDQNGNRTQTTTDGSVSQTQTVNAQDQLTMAGYAYDATGNTTADSHGTETYNAADQLTTLTNSSGTLHLGYAGTDQTELITAGVRNYTYGRTSSATGLPLVESFTADSGTNFAYLYDPNGTPLAITGVGAGSNDHYLALDGLGSVLASVRQDGVTTATYSYDPWGNQTATGQNGSAIALYQLYGYTGGTTDPAYNGLEHLGHRWYDPTTGRFTQQDDIAALADPSRANRYTYASDNPINYTDPTGRYSFQDFERDFGRFTNALGNYVDTVGGEATSAGISAGAAGAIGGCAVGSPGGFAGCGAGAITGGVGGFIGGFVYQGIVSTIHYFGG